VTPDQVDILREMRVEASRHVEARSEEASIWRSSDNQRLLNSSLRMLAKAEARVEALAVAVSAHATCQQCGGPR
jgi:hypothetical protein